MRNVYRSEIVWRLVAIIASIAAIAALPVFRERLDDDRIGIWVTFALPFALGLAAMTAPMDLRTRILLLWLASLLASFVAMLSLWTGFGLVVIPIILAYLLAAWGLNEASAAPG